MPHVPDEFLKCVVFIGFKDTYGIVSFLRLES
jgi:hypothetical protein